MTKRESDNVQGNKRVVALKLVAGFVRRALAQGGVVRLGTVILSENGWIRLGCSSSGETVYIDSGIDHGSDLYRLKGRLFADMGQVGKAGIFPVLLENGIEARMAVEIIAPRSRLIICGAGHVGRAVAVQAAVLGYEVVVIEDRAEFLDPVRFGQGEIDLTQGNFVSVLNDLEMTARDCVIIVTRGHQYDEECLKAVIGRGAGYVGMIGSKRRVISVFQRLVEAGFPEADLSCVHAPIGLRIGAVTPEEIAVSILAEIISEAKGKVS